MYGAIGNCLAKPVFMISKSTNKEDFLSFLKLLKRSIGRSKVFFVYDNHRAHMSIAS